MVKANLNRIKKLSSTNKAIIMLSSGAIIQSVLQLIVIAILSRLISVSDFGIVALLQTLMSFSLIFSQFGVSQVIIQKKNIDDTIIKNATFISICFGLFIGLCFYFSASFFAVFFKNEGLSNVIKIFSPYFLIKSISFVSEAQLSRALKFKDITRIQIVSYLFGYGLFSIIFALLGFGYWSLIIGMYMQMFISLGLYLNLNKFKVTLYVSKRICSDLLFNGSGFTLNTILNYLTEEADNFIVGRKLGTTSLGIYTRAFQLYSLSSRFFGLIYDKIYFPVLSIKQDDKEYLKDHFLKSMNLCFVIITPLSLLLSFNAKWIIFILLGNKWDFVILPFQILSLSISFRFGTKISKSFVKAMNLSYESSWLYISFLIMLISLIYTLIDKGINGVALAVLIANFINNIQFIVMISKKLHIGIKYYYKILIRTTLLSVIIFGINIFTLFNYGWILNLICVLISICLFAYLLTKKRNILFSID